MNWTNLLLGSKGRINRKSWWVGLLPILVLLVLVVLYLKFLTGILPGWANIMIPAAIALEALYFTANLSVKRMHDYGRSAHFLWLLFAPLIVAALFLLQQKYFPLQTHEEAVLIYTVLISLAIITCLWMLVEMGFLRSTSGGDAYGPAPADLIDTQEN